ncbi:MAG: hypothetical protein DRQ44_03765 [Gammaproteobacteria bacterium]|nr:MAG: hypothetical protein DRQ44_03765 [Gammaproteobacteria bacterium]
MKKLLTVSLLLLCSGSVMAEKYMCIPEASGGLGYDKKSNSWSVSKFDTGRNYIVNVNDKDNPSYAATVTTLNETLPSYLCKEEPSVNALVCNSFLGQLNFSKGTLRFIESYMFGYVQGKDNKYNAPKVTVGSCSPYQDEASSVAAIGQ